MSDDRDLHAALDVLNLLLTNHRNLVVGHDHVHPDRSDCGGVGRCALMLAEHQAEKELLDCLARLARAGAEIEAVELGEGRRVFAFAASEVQIKRRLLHEGKQEGGDALADLHALFRAGARPPVEAGAS
jgi:hypothetical protein